MHSFDREVNALKKLPNVLPCRRRLVLTNDESGHVEDEHGGGEVVDGVFEDEADVDGGGAHSAAAHVDGSDWAVGLVEQQHPEFFVGKVVEIALHVLHGYFGGGDGRFVVGDFIGGCACA